MWQEISLSGKRSKEKKRKGKTVCVWLEQTGEFLCLLLRGLFLCQKGIKNKKLKQAFWISQKSLVAFVF